MKLDKNSIIYDSLSDEYRRNLQMQAQAKKIIASSPKGSIQSIKRGNKQYFYLKYRDGSKVRSLYLGEKSNPNIVVLIEQIEKRRKYQSVLNKLKAEEKWLEKAIKPEKTND